MGIADLHLLILLPVVTVAELAVNEAPSEWNEGECVGGDQEATVEQQGLVRGLSERLP